jgi:hypothetical protein
MLLKSLLQISLFAILTSGWIYELAPGRQTSPDCSFFQPDEFVFESIRMPLAEGLTCIEAIEGLAEEIFLVSASLEPAVFVDIGYNASYSQYSSSAVFDLDQTADYLIHNQDRLGRRIYLVHNHPKFENIPLAPPSFADLVVLSNLRMHLAELGLEIEVSGIVVNSGGGIWRFNTTPELENSTMIPLRSADTQLNPFSRWTPAMKLNMKHSLGWTKIWKDYPEDPRQMAQAMREKGLEVDYYKTVQAFISACSLPFSSLQKQAGDCGRGGGTSWQEPG